MAAEAIFREIEMDRAVGGGMLSYSYAVHFSWYQIKHEELHDVLLGAVEGASKAKLHMRDIPGQGVVVSCGPFRRRADGLAMLRAPFMHVLHLLECVSCQSGARFMGGCD